MHRENPLAYAWYPSVVETLQIIVAHHALPGCLALNLANLMIQNSLVLVRLLKRYTAGSPFLAPVEQALSDNPVAEAYVSSRASLIRKLPSSSSLERQCLAGTFSELGINAGAAESLSCYVHWKDSQGVKGRQGEYNLYRG